MAETNKLQLFRGSRIRARVLELQAGGELLVSYQGQLVRVKNNTTRIFQKNDILNLQVLNTQPLEFKIYEKTAMLDRMI